MGKKPLFCNSLKINNSETGEILCKQDAVGTYIWAWLFLAYVKFVECVRDMWVVQWYCVFEGLVEMCEVVGMELYIGN